MNPLATTRMIANLALVMIMLILFIAALLGHGATPIWVWLTASVAVAGGVVQFFVSILRPSSIRPAWDEQVVASHRAALQFGYWAALMLYALLFLLTQFGSLSPGTAFLLLAPILGAAPSVWMLGAAMMGRAG